MNGVSYRLLFFWGFVTYSAIFFLWAVLAAYGLSHGIGAQITSYVVTFIAVYLAARSIGNSTLVAAVAYGVGFGVVHIFLDALVVLPAIGLVAFFSPYVWLEYGIVAISPVVYALTAKLLRAPAFTPPSPIESTQ